MRKERGTQGAALLQGPAVSGKAVSARDGRRVRSGDEGGPGAQAHREGETRAQHAGKVASFSVNGKEADSMDPLRKNEAPKCEATRGASPFTNSPPRSPGPLQPPERNGGQSGGRRVHC